MSGVEDTFCPDVFVSGVDHIEILENAMIRVVFYAERVEPSGEKVRVIVCRVVRPLASIMSATRMFIEALNQNGTGFVGGPAMVAMN